MSKKHFVRMADVISEEVLRLKQCSSYDGGRMALDLVSAIAIEFADMAKADNGAFDRQKFYAACGLDTEGRAN
jgi:hypothetical protein